MASADYEFLSMISADLPLARLYIAQERGRLWQPDTISTPGPA